MSPNELGFVKRVAVLRLVAALVGAALLTSCATSYKGASAEEVVAAKTLAAARSATKTPEERAALYLDAARMTGPMLGSGTEPTLAHDTYNHASSELTILLRSSGNGRLWDHPLTLTSGSRTYHLRLQPAERAVWSPGYFNSFIPSDVIKEKLVKEQNHQAGVGGSLVGVRTTNPRENFVSVKGLSAPVTATVDFKGDAATLALRRPAKQPTALVEGKVRPLAVDYSAAISYYQPPGNLLLVGLQGALRAGKVMDKTGLYFIEPYDPDRIPVVFVHGLMSTPFNWVQTINGLQADPEIRKRYQFWVFGYPTGNPILYSALRLREELARADKLYPNHRPYVVVGHSMGGMLTHAQVVTVSKSTWEKDKTVGAAAHKIFSENPNDSLVVRAMTFQANPRIKRVVFVCTPHRGSEMATSGVGKFGISLIRLPLTVANAMTDALTNAEISALTGSSKGLPNSVSGLKPSNPSFPVVNSPPITVPYHSIIGDRGKGNTPNSTDGVVAYWSSHLDGAQSECIVPGPHSSCELPQTIAELKRILLLHCRKS